MRHEMGHYAFVGGVLLAIIAGLVQTTSTFLAFSLIILGFVVGVLNWPAKDATHLLIAVIAILAAGSADFQMLNVTFDPLGTVLNSVFSFINVFVAPVALVVALKFVVYLARR
jgi:hypothetical protein